MGNAMTTDFLKECMADSLLKLMENSDFSKITVNEIAAGANVNRSTWFRNFHTKINALTFKLVRLWERWAEEHKLAEPRRYTPDNALDFFRFNYAYRRILTQICVSGQQTAIYDAFNQVLTPRFFEGTDETYVNRFYAYGLYGLLEEWIHRDFRESPEEMTRLFMQNIAGRS